MQKRDERMDRRTHVRKVFYNFPTTAFGRRQEIIRDIVKRESSKEYVCIAELLVYCRRMEVRRNDNELKMGNYKCVIIKLLH